MKKLASALLALLTSGCMFAQSQNVTVRPNGSGVATFNTSQITHYVVPSGSIIEWAAGATAQADPGSILVGFGSGGGGGGSGTVTNTGTLTANALMIGTGGVNITALSSLGTNGQILTSTGASTPPIWMSAAGGGNVSTSGTINSGETAQWNGATTLISVPNTGTGNYVLQTSPTITTPTISTITAGSSSDLTLNANGTNQNVFLVSTGLGGVTAKSASTSSSLNIQSTASVATSNSDVFGQYLNDSSGATLAAQQLTFLEATTHASATSSVRFQTLVAGTLAERMRISSAGNLLVGTTSDTGLGGAGNLSVNGIIQVTNTIQAASGNDLRLIANGTNQGVQIQAFGTGTIRLINLTNPANVVIEDDNTQSTSNTSILSFALRNSSGATITGSQILGGLSTLSVGAETSYLAFQTIIAGSSLEKARISSQGNLLVGTTSDTGLTGLGGLSVGSATQSTSTGTGAIITAGGVGIAKALFVGGNVNFGGTVTIPALNVAGLVTNTSSGLLGTATLSNFMDVTFGNAQGDILYRNASGWVVLTPGSSGQFLQTQGASANVLWATSSGSGNVSTSGTITSGQTAQWNSTTTLISVANTGTGSYVLQGSPTITTPTISTITADTSSDLTLAANGTNQTVVLEPFGTGSVKVTTAAATATISLTSSAAASTSNAAALNAVLNDSSGAQIATEIVSAYGVTTHASAASLIKFANYVGGTLQESFRLSQAGNLLIGLTSDASLSGAGGLAVNGTTRLVPFSTAGIVTNNSSGVLASLSNAASPSSTLLGILASGTPSSSTFLRGDGTWAAAGGGGGSPGGSTTQIQYNNAGSFGGDSGFTTNGTGVLAITPAARSSGSAPYLVITAPTDLTLTASTESIGISHVGATRQFATGALALQREYVFGAPTYAFVAGSTLSLAATVSIPGPPIVGTNATITLSDPLLVDNDGIAATTSPGIHIRNATVSTSPIKAQWSPQLRWEGHSWTGSVDATVTYVGEVKTNAGGGTGALAFSEQTNTGGFSVLFAMNPGSTETETGFLTIAAGATPTVGTNTVVVNGTGKIGAKTSVQSGVGTISSTNSLFIGSLGSGTSLLSSTQGSSETSAANLFDVATTWNNAGNTPTLFKANVTDTASNAGSLLMDLQVASTSKFKIAKDGTITTASTLAISGAGFANANGSVVTVLGSLGPVGSHTTVQKWMAWSDGTTTYYSPGF